MSARPWLDRLLRRVAINAGDSVGTRVAKSFVLALRGFLHHRTPQAAAALSFATVLALVPFLALVFSALRGFGVYGAVIEGSVRPWIDRTFGTADGVVPLREAFHQVLEFGEHADMSALGIVGTAILVYLAVSLLIRVEEALNRVFGARRARSATRRLADYAAIFFLIPASIFVATAVGRWADAQLRGFSAGADVFTVAVIFGAILAVYIVMPQRTVRLRWAAAGALFGAVSWYATLRLHAAFQVGVANYSALYAGFAAVPLFLAFVLLSWNLILAGAEFAAALNDPGSYAWRIDHRTASPTERRHAAVELVLVVVRAFEAGIGPVPLSALASELHIPQEETGELVTILIDHGILVRARGARGTGYLPSRPLAEARVSEIVEAIDGARRRSSAEVVSQTLEQMQTAARESRSNVTVADLLERAS